MLSKEIYGRASRSCTLPFFAGIHRSYLLFRGEPAGWYPMKSIFLPPWNGTILPPCANTKGKGTIISRFPTVRKRIAADFSTGRGGGMGKKVEQVEIATALPEKWEERELFFLSFFFFLIHSKRASRFNLRKIFLRFCFDLLSEIQIDSKWW